MKRDRSSKPTRKNWVVKRARDVVFCVACGRIAEFDLFTGMSKVDIHPT
jgi:hypothetical protein